MVVLFSWLKDFVDIDVTPVVLADKLVKAGFEIESITDLSEACKNIVVGKILSIEKHPNADKLLVCKIDVGTEILQIVTGAHNVSVGDIVPVCKDGAVLPSGKKIVSGELRGVMSSGMLCGGSELGLTASDYEAAGVDGIFLMEDKYPLGTDINEVLGTNDYLLDVEVTANRPDCNSIIGVAREVAAVLNKPFKELESDFNFKTEGKVQDYVSVTVKAEDLCPRYMAAAVKNIVIRQSSELIRRRLRLVGLRPINNVVDITNYVLTEVGQPMHAFDSRLLNNSAIVVRRAQENEVIVTLDGKENKLTSENLVICDDTKPVALAGVMGGLNSGINDSTETIIFESARFKRDNIRRTSRNLGIRSDSSSRFEKGIDFKSQEIALSRALQLIESEGAGTVVGGYIDVMSGNSGNRTLTVSTEKINAILGIVIPVADMVSILNRLQLKTVANGTTLTIDVPGYREDIETANDVSEEIIRLFGYDNIVSAKLDGMEQTHGGRMEKDLWIGKIKTLLSGTAKFSEIVSYSFIPSGFADSLKLKADDKRRQVIKIINPLSDDMAVMRTDLVYSMLTTVTGNILRGNKNVKLYEVAKVYLPKSLPLTDTADEPETLILAESGEDSDFYSLKATVCDLAAKLNLTLDFDKNEEEFLHPGRRASVLLKGNKVGFIGEVHPLVAEGFKCDQRIYVCELNLEALIADAKVFLPYVGISRYPAISRDLAFVLDENINAGDLLKCVKNAAGELLENIEIFDVYQGKGVAEGKKSIALSLSFRAADRTLVDKEVVEIVENILSAAKSELQATLRE